MYIGVIGAAVCDKQTEEIAYLAGKKIAEAGAVLVCGGLSGVMEAAAKGAFEAGGLTVGVLPGGSRKEANPYIKVAVATGIGEARNAVIAKTCDALIAVGGEYGTLSEIALGLKAGKKIIGIGTWRLVKEDKPLKAVIEAKDAVEAVKLALS